MSQYKIELRQLVDYPRCRVYRDFFRNLQKDCETAVCFVHVVGRDEPLRQVRDHDNIETKQIIDVLSAFVLLDDNGLLCETHQWTERGDSSRTEVYVVKKEDFLAWALTRKGS